MAEYLIQGSTLTAIADAIRAKTGSNDALNPADFATAISGIQSGGGIDSSLRYFTCHADPIAGTITLYGIHYDLIYADTGSYDVTIPDMICGLRVIISA